MRKVVNLLRFASTYVRLVRDTGRLDLVFALADAHGIELVGGDTTAGPLNVCITVFGQLPPGQALLRSGARPGDALWVSGSLGDARLALEVFRGRVALAGEAFDTVRRAMELPQPRVALGLALRRRRATALGEGLHVLAQDAAVVATALDAAEVDAHLARQLAHCRAGVGEREGGFVDAAARGCRSGRGGRCGCRD